MWNISNSDFDVKSTGLKHQFGEIEHGPILTFEDDAKGGIQKTDTEKVRPEAKPPLFYNNNK